MLTLNSTFLLRKEMSLLLQSAILSMVAGSLENQMAAFGWSLLLMCFISPLNQKLCLLLFSTCNPHPSLSVINQAAFSLKEIL